MTEEERKGLAVWNAMQHDPTLLEGVTVGEMADLISATTKVLEDLKVLRNVPVGLMLRMSKGSDSVADNFENLRELLRVDTVRATLTKLAEEIEG